MPSQAQLTRGLRDAVDHKFTENPDDVRPKAVRSVAEEQLGLDQGYLAGKDEWRERSKTIIQDRFEELLAGATPQKKRKPSEGLDEDIGDGRPPKKAKRKSNGMRQEQAKAGRQEKKKDKSKDLSSSPTVNEESVREDIEMREDNEPVAVSGNNEIKADQTPNSPKPNDEGLDDSDLSSLIDQPPKPRRKKKVASTEPNDKPKKVKSAPKKASDSQVSSQEAELKELQNQLLQCGVRKIWAMHLKRFETQKDKVAELKRMLREVGMEGRFSKEKARQIKDARELRADIEAIQEGDQKWGMADGNERRRRAAANRVVDFDDDEESG